MSKVKPKTQEFELVLASNDVGLGSTVEYYDWIC